MICQQIRISICRNRKKKLKIGLFFFFICKFRMVTIQSAVPWCQSISPQKKKNGTKKPDEQPCKSSLPKFYSCLVRNSFESWENESVVKMAQTRQDHGTRLNIVKFNFHIKKKVMFIAAGKEAICKNNFVRFLNEIKKKRKR